MWGLNNMLLKNKQVNEEIKTEIKKYLKTNDYEDTATPNLWDATSSTQREVHSNTGLPQINNLTHHLNELEKEEQTKPKVSRRKKIIKIREEINKIDF